VKRKTFTGFCSKFIQETIYQVSSESPEFDTRYYKKTLWWSFSGHTVHSNSGSICSNS